MIALNEAQIRELDAATDAPARHVEDGCVRVALVAKDFEWIKGHLDLPDEPRRVDTRDRREYALVPLGVYETFKAFFEDDPLTPQEQAYLLREAGLRAGWGDPEMDVYDRLHGENP